VASADPAGEAARRRIEATLDHARHVDLSRLIVGVAGPDIEAARRVASSAAAAAGRSPIVHEAQRSAKAWVLQAFADRAYSGTWVATETAASVTRPADRLAVAEALADAVTASAVQDLVDGDTVDALRASWDTLEASSSIPEPGALNDFTRSIAGTGIRRGGMRSLVFGVVMLLMGFTGLAAGSAFGVGLLVVGAVIVTDALRGR
jgi:hypothetical protein